MSRAAAEDGSPWTPNFSGIKTPHELTLKENWKLFKGRWNNYTLLTGMNKQDRALFENCLADDAVKLLNGFSFERPEYMRTVKEIITKFEEYAIGDVNDTMERFLFNGRAQHEGEDFENFLSYIPIRAQTCKFCDMCEDSMIRGRIVLGVNSEETERRWNRILYTEYKLTIEKEETESKCVNANVLPYEGTLSMLNMNAHKPAGICRMTIRNPKNGKQYSVPFVVCENDKQPIIGYKTSVQMQLIKIEDVNYDVIASVNTNEDMFTTMFNGQLGKLPGTQQLRLKPAVQPVVMASRRVPISIRKI
ncbi:hypothetical protein LSH36_152g00002 [Paralvinella palmiformis]|uniref:Uncharacterized protein n=1 Tax=Paralvinella palmiformis TaxID=53620 RepID=A0AAD9N8Z4_9ANNE|nr:hypothetical protein LSH36_152g00002 [Paralvinella palmiformis]